MRLDALEKLAAGVGVSGLPEFVSLRVRRSRLAAFDRPVYFVVVVVVCVLAVGMSIFGCHSFVSTKTPTRGEPWCLGVGLNLAPTMVSHRRRLGSSEQFLGVNDSTALGHWGLVLVSQLTTYCSIGANPKSKSEGISTDRSPCSFRMYRPCRISLGQAWRHCRGQRRASAPAAPEKALEASASHAGEQGGVSARPTLDPGPARPRR